MTYKPRHCWDCGTRVIGGEVGAHEILPNFRLVRFGLSDTSYCESPFCQDCAARPWTTTRTLDFERAVNAVDPRHQIRVLTVEGILILRTPILALVEATPTVNV